MHLLACADAYQYPNTQAPYVLDLLPVSLGIAVTSSDRYISLFDPRRLGHGPTKRIQTRHGHLTRARIYDADQSVVCTAGEKGAVSVWDLRLNPSKAEALRIGDESLPSLISLASSSPTNTLAAGTELDEKCHQASILIWDVRSAATPRLQFKEIHSDDVTELNFHPTTPHLLLSGSTDGIVNICDTRIADEDEVVIQAFNHGSVHRAGFLNETEVYAVSHDEKFALYDAADSELENGSATLNLGDIRRVVGCQYVADVFAKLKGAGAVIGVGAQEQLFQLIYLTKAEGKWALDKERLVGLMGAHGSEVVRSFCFVNDQQVVLTGGEDGCIKSWRAL